MAQLLTYPATKIPQFNLIQYARGNNIAGRRSELHVRVGSVNFPHKLCEVKGQVYLVKTFLQSFQPQVDKRGGHPCLLAQIKHLNPPSEKLHTHPNFRSPCKNQNGNKCFPDISSEMTNSLLRLRFCIIKAFFNIFEKTQAQKNSTAQKTQQFFGRELNEPVSTVVT